MASSRAPGRTPRQHVFEWRQLRLKRLGNPVGEVWLINDCPGMRIAFPWWPEPLAACNDQLGLRVAERSQLQEQGRLVNGVYGVVVEPIIFDPPDNIRLGIESHGYVLE